jgi:hypothetical protein
MHLSLQSRPLGPLVTIIIPPPRRPDTTYLRASVHTVGGQGVDPACPTSVTYTRPVTFSIACRIPLFPTQLLACWPVGFYLSLSSFAMANGFGFTFGAGQHVKIVHSWGIRRITTQRSFLISSHSFRAVN